MSRPEWDPNDPRPETLGFMVLWSLVGLAIWFVVIASVARLWGILS